jgi:hypothetical protein
MPRFLVVANQTASSIELTQAIQEVMVEHGEASFVLLVPETRSKICSIGKRAIAER